VIALRALDPPADRPLLERLWAAALGPVWPLAPRALDIARHGLVAEEDGAEVGVVVLDPAGSIPLLLVDPASQRRGVGTRLLDGAMERLGELGATTVGLGSGGDDYLWPGVPDDLPAAVGFFAARGWRYGHTVIDLTADLRGYRAPAGVLERAAAAGVFIDVLAERDRAEVLAFEAATFPDWMVWFERLDASVLVARDAAGAVVGTLLFRGPPDATVYAPMLGPDAGTIGCVGVAEAARGAGVGSAMVAQASELLGERGAGTGHIGWTRRERFYARLGYAPWRRYHMATRPVPAPARPRRRGPTTEEELRAAWVKEPPKLTGKILVADYDPAWPGLFRREADRIRSLLRKRVLQLEHIGSTSVPGLAAKPIIDILLVVPDPSDEPAYVPDLEAAGYELVIREPDWYQHRCFKGPDTNVNLHVYPPGCPEIERYLTFRDRLRSHPGDRARYQRVKHELAERDWTYVQEYADAKTEVVESILAGALGRSAAP
jgi:GrpB-like predicted nucleotidyltransferase (UPF0157 family)/ribosomal protein S18 acetylase RimI-like enzyme